MGIDFCHFLFYCSVYAHAGIKFMGFTWKSNHIYIRQTWQTRGIPYNVSTSARLKPGNLQSGNVMVSHRWIRKRMFTVHTASTPLHRVKIVWGKMYRPKLYHFPFAFPPAAVAKSALFSGFVGCSTPVLDLFSMQLKQTIHDFFTLFSLYGVPNRNPNNKCIRMRISPILCSCISASGSTNISCLVYSGISDQNNNNSNAYNNNIMFITGNSYGKIALHSFPKMSAKKI